MQHLPGNAVESPALDAAQLTRIEATHRGFGYQHLYAVACLLTMDRTNTDVIVIEHDEDVEVVRASDTVYVQVKTRNRPLRMSDLNGVLPRFDLLREEHSAGRRAGNAHFAVVSNNPPGPDLVTRLAATSPSDVTFLWPGGPDSQAELQLPAPWPGLAGAMEDCINLANSVPFATLAPQTLVLKLAGLVQYLATGHTGHTVTRAQMRGFLEQLVVQLHDFPQPPADYRPQNFEPDPLAPGRVRLIVGVSGSGKTAWASYAALHDPSPTAYFDVGELPSQALASSLARELVARFLAGRASGSGGATLPAASGLELLALLSRRFREDGLAVAVVLDNVHRVSAETLRSLAAAAPDLRFVLLAQPWPGQATVEALLEIQTEVLGGWSLDDLAAVFSANDCPVEVATGQRLLRLTAGVPLYVNAAARLAVRAYAGDVGAFLNAVEGRLAHVQTAQEAILGETFEQLTLQARIAASLLDLADVPLDNEEALELISTAELAQAAAASAVRELIRSGVVQVIGGGVKLHDAFRLLARDGRATLGVGSLGAALEALVVMLERSLTTGWTVGRFGLWLRLLPQTGRHATLIDVATQEEFHQVGDPSELRAALEAVAQSSDLGVEERFWALDALAFWDYCAGSYGQISDVVTQMTDVAGVGLDARAATALAMKQMLAASMRNDRDGVESAYRVGLERAEDSERLQMIVRYNHALALFHLGANEEVASEAFDLVMDYYGRLGLELEDVLAVRPVDIRAVVPDTSSRDDDFRHTGDSLQLLGAANKRLGNNSVAMAYLHAMKFFTAALAWRSAARVGQDAVDEVLVHGDLEGARHICENLLLPLVEEYQLADLLVPIRAQYAVVLAWCGEVDAAREEMTKLQAYHLTGIGASELANQWALINQIAADGTPRENPAIEG